MQGGEEAEFGEGGGRVWGASKERSQRLFHAELTESRGQRPARSAEIGEAVGRATRGMDRETRGSQVPMYFYGTCETARLSIHVPAEGRRPTAGHQLCSL